RTTKRPDAYLTTPRKIKKQQTKAAKQQGLVPVTEKTKRISGVSRGHHGSSGKLDSDPDRRGHYRGGDLVVDAGYGRRHQVRGPGRPDRREHVADRPAHRQRLQMPGRRPRQGLVRARDRDRQYR